MKYENTDIFTFNSYKPKKEPVPVNSGAEESEGSKESSGEISPEDRNMGETANPVKDASDLVSILTPDTEEMMQDSLSEDLKKDYPEDVSGFISTESDIELDIESNIEPSIESAVLSGSTETIFKSTSLSKNDSLPKTASMPFPDLSLESEIFERAGQEAFPFEGFVGYEDNVLKASPVSEAFGIVTTGIEPLELTPTGAVITGYITSARRDEVRLGTYVVVPYENGEKLFARVGKLQYRQEFVVDDATEIHSRRMLSSRGSSVNEDDYKFLACLDPLCILYRKTEGTLTRRMADRIPHPNTPILPVTDRLEVQIGLNIPEEGIFLGHLSVGGELLKTHSEPETVAYYLRNDYSMGDPLIFWHA